MKTFAKKFVAGIRVASQQEVMEAEYASIYQWEEFFLAVSAAEKLQGIAQFIGQQTVWNWWNDAAPQCGINRRISVFKSTLVDKGGFTEEEATIFISNTIRNRRCGFGISAGATSAAMVRQISIVLAGEVTEAIRFPNGEIGYRLGNKIGQLHHCCYATGASRALMGSRNWDAYNKANTTTGEGLESLFLAVMVNWNNGYQLPIQVAEQYNIGICGLVVYCHEDGEMVWRAYDSFVGDTTTNSPKTAWQHAQTLSGKLKETFLNIVKKDIESHPYWTKGGASYVPTGLLQ